MPAYALVAMLAYLIGAIPWGLWLGRMFRGIDIRRQGSGNLGATNVYRTLGPALGIATLLLDVLKGAVPVWVLPRIVHAPGFDPGVARVIAGLAAVTGHVWTVFAGFRGGKGVATTVGVLLALSPAAFGVFVTVFVVAVAVSGFVSVGSTLGAIAFTIAAAEFEPGGVRSPVFALAVVLAILIVWRHRENYRRLARGEERRFSLKPGARA
jgi:glycerol-3-phosphate acyltransferase PlsY